METDSTPGVTEQHIMENLRMIKCQAKEFGSLIVEMYMRVSIKRVKDMDRENTSKETVIFWKDSL